jgi:hypothetical protein
MAVVASMFGSAAVNVSSVSCMHPHFWHLASGMAVVISA